MARKPRDHAAEYARRKAKAAERKMSVRQYRRIRENEAWSQRHSHRKTSQAPTFGIPGSPEYDEKQIAYQKAFRTKYEDREDFLNALHHYLVDLGDMSDEEFNSRYRG